MISSYDIAIIGAGPAGMTAAITASEAGAKVIVLDDKKFAGGQIYRNVCNSPLKQVDALGPDYLKGRSLVERFEQCRAEKVNGASVWHVSDSGEVLFSKDQSTTKLTTREIIVSCGAMERPFPIPGWQLPGVMSAGSAQVMLKSDGVVHDDAVFVGTGPLLYLIAAQYLRLGVRVKALVDTTPKANYLDSFTSLPGALTEYTTLIKGLGLLKEIQKSGTSVYKYAQNLTITGETNANGISFRSGKKNHNLSCDHIFLHQGVIPNLNMTRSLNLDHYWSEQQLCWTPTLDSWGQSSATNISVAGDCSGIIGAEGAEHMGRLVALNQLSKLGIITTSTRDKQALTSQHRLARFNQFRRFIDKLYRPTEDHRIPTKNTTVVCRCEEVDLAALRQEFERGSQGPNELKMMSRCGMGPCQGRQCGHTVSELLAQWRGEEVKEVGYYHLRSPMRLLNLTEFSQFSHIEPTSTTDSSQVQIQEVSP